MSKTSVLDFRHDLHQKEHRMIASVLLSEPYLSFLKQNHDQ